MLNFKSQVAGLFMAMAALGFSVTSAHATLTSRDLNTLGDGLITFDSDTGYEWLDLTLTTGASYYDITPASPFIADLFFDFANRNEIVTFFTNAGATLINSGRVASQFAAASALIALVGETSSFISDSDGVFSDHSVSSGWADAIPSDPINVLHPFIEVNRTLGLGRFAVPTVVSVEKNGGAPNDGSWLRRPTFGVSVPEPPTLLLFGVGLVGFAVITRRRRLRQRD